MVVVPYTWVFKLKTLDAAGTKFLEKSRCCICGNRQTPELDFDPHTVYAPVASHEAVRILLAVAASNDLIVEGGDISNAYLYGDIDVTIYMEQPTDSSCQLEFPGMVCKLLKSIYGLKQAGHIWGSLLMQSLRQWGFEASAMDPRVLFKNVGEEFIALVVVVDDLTFASNSPRMIHAFKAKLAETFDVKLFGRMSTFLGWETSFSQQGIKISQARYTQELLDRHGMKHCNGTLTPMGKDVDLRPRLPSESPLSLQDHAKYRRMVGELLYLAVCTRPDISFAVSSLARSLHAPTRRHFSMINRVLRYLSTTKSHGILYPAGNGEQLDLRAFCDADWAGDLEKRHSTTGFFIEVNGAPVAWKSVRQSIIALSTAEAEYIALSTTGKEISWIRRLFAEIKDHKRICGDVPLLCTPIFTDSTAALSIAEKDSINARTKHIDVRFHHIRLLRMNDVISFAHVPSARNRADFLTKPLERAIYQPLRDEIVKEVRNSDINSDN